MNKHIILALAVLSLVACSNKQQESYVHIRDMAIADIFYVCSTETSDWVNEQGDTMHFADMTRAEHRAALYSEIHGVDSLVCPENCNFYAPYYRQMIFEAYSQPTPMLDSLAQIAAKDVNDAF